MLGLPSIWLNMKKKTFFLFLIFFTILTTGIDFFHTETTFEIYETDCPACLFERSLSLTPDITIIILIFTSIFLFLLDKHDDSINLSFVILSIKNKSPPLI